MKEPGVETDMRQPLVDCPSHVRAGFAFRVYCILSLQLFLTAAVSTVVVVNKHVEEYVVHAPWVMIASSLLSLCLLCPLHSMKSRYPHNMWLLLAFTMCESYAVGYVCAIYDYSGRGNLILYSITLTGCAFLGLSGVVWWSKRDMQFTQSWLISSLALLLCMGLLSAFIPYPVVHVLLATTGVIVFSGFVLYDTSQMMLHMHPDDAIVASVQLYLDVLNMFLYILQLLTASTES
jgi:FtsH-binding integral membrane protein